LIRQEKHDGDQPTSIGAALALRAIGAPQAVRLLFAALDDKDPQTRAGAAIGLGILDGSPKALAALAREHRPRWYRRPPDWPGKRQYDPRTVHRLIEALRDENPELRHNAALALGLTGDARGVEPLIGLVKQDRDAKVREAAVRALGMIDDPRTAAPLMGALDDESRPVVLRAVEALRELKDPRAAEALIAALKRPGPSAAAAHATAPHEDPLATEETVRKALIAAVAATGDARGLEPLAASLAHKGPRVRETAALALGCLRDRRGLEPLLAALKDESSWVREKTAVALGLLRDPRAARPLGAVLGDQAAEVRNAALRALAMLDTPESHAPLVEQLQAAPLGLRYRTSFWVAMFSLGWRPPAPEDCVRLLAAREHRVLLVALWPSARKVLLADAQAGDPAAVQDIAELLIALGKEDTVGDLAALLKTKGTKGLAATYAHCGKKELRDAAESWAQQHGRMQLPAPSPGTGVQWGAM